MLSARMYINSRDSRARVNRERIPRPVTGMEGSWELGRGATGRPGIARQKSVGAGSRGAGVPCLAPSPARLLKERRNFCPTRARADASSAQASRLYVIRAIMDGSLGG